MPSFDCTGMGIRIVFVSLADSITSQQTAFGLVWVTGLGGGGHRHLTKQLIWFYILTNMLRVLCTEMNGRKINARKGTVINLHRCRLKINALKPKLYSYS
jgi:hypothetical protein